MQAKSEPLVSIIMNCFNGEKYLHEAIDSVKAQTYKNWELIFWNNQSTDQSAEIFKSYDDPRLKYFYAQKHTYLYEARNYAIEKGSGDFYAFLDVDDWWSNEKLEKQIPLFDDPYVGLVYGNYWFVDENTNVQYPFYKKQLPSGNILRFLLRNYCIGLLTIIVRKKTYDSLYYGFNPIFHVIGDFDLASRISAVSSIDVVQEPIAYYRFHSNNESKHKIELNLNELEMWRDKMKNDPIFSHLKEFKTFIKMVEYRKAIYFLDNKKYMNVFKCLIILKFSIHQLKLLFKILIPKSILVYIKLISNKI